MSAIAIDIETDSLDATRVWCICTEDEKGHKQEFQYPDTISEEGKRFEALLLQYDTYVFHAGLQFDVPTLNRLLKKQVIDPTKVVDTLVLSRLFNYMRKGGHSLDSWGSDTGVAKDHFSDFTHLSPELLQRCHSDTASTMLIYKKLKYLVGTPASDIEHYITLVCEQMHTDGFYFDTAKANALLQEVERSTKVLEANMRMAFEPKLALVKTLKYRTKDDGEEYTTVAKARLKYYKTEVKEDELLCYDWVAFNPSSPVDRIDRLWDAGWKPYEKTKGAIEFSRTGHNLSAEEHKKKKKRFDTYGYTCSEGNLSTLPASAPAGARTLAQWLTLEGRRRSLVEWIGSVDPSDSRIHGTFFHLGAWTQRLSHAAPNEANIPAAFHSNTEELTPVEEVKRDYNGRMRALWCVPDKPEYWLVGTDADSIQLRILAHAMRSEAYVQAIVHGDKSQNTDIHNMNRKALSLEHITRDDAKTFIYAFLLGGGLDKLAHILKTDVDTAGVAVETFLSSIPGLKKLKLETIPRIASRGYFLGLDGRKVLVPSQHKTLAGMLQAGEAVVMKHATRIWREQLKSEGLMHRVKLCTWPHDEWQTEAQGTKDFAVYIGEVQCKAIEQAGVELDLFCPLAGQYKVGKTWEETH